MLRQIVSLAAAFTIGALLATIVAERKAHERDTTSAYIEGLSAHASDFADGYADGYANAVRDSAPIMEDDPRWDCATMGNKICGPEL